MFIAGHTVLTSYEEQPTTCHNCNEQGHHSIERPYRRSSTPSNTSTRTESWANAVKQGTLRQQQEKGGQDITHMSDEPDTESPAKDTSPSGGLLESNSQCDLAKPSANDNLPGVSTQIQDGEFPWPQEIVESGRQDNRKDSDGMETGDEDEEMTHDISQCRDSDPPTPGDRKKRYYAHNVKHASEYRMTKNPICHGRTTNSFTPSIESETPEKTQNGQGYFHSEGRIMKQK